MDHRPFRISVDNWQNGSKALKASIEKAAKKDAKAAKKAEQVNSFAFSLRFAKS
jgi:hypothetical protein